MPACHCLAEHRDDRGARRHEHAMTLLRRPRQDQVSVCCRAARMEKVVVSTQHDDEETPTTSCARPIVENVVQPVLEREVRGAGRRGDAEIHGRGDPTGSSGGVVVAVPRAR